MIDGVAKKMSDYFFGRFSDIVSPIKVEDKENKNTSTLKRVKKLKSNFLNKYIYSLLLIFILLIVVILNFIFL